MRRFPCFSAIPLLSTMAASVLAACTFNIASHMHEVVETSDVVFDTVHFDTADEAPSLQQAVIVVVGRAGSNATARARLAALRSPGESSEVLGAGWSFLFALRELNVLDLDITSPSNTDVWLDELMLEVPRSAALDLTVGSHALDVSAMGSSITASATSGAMTVETTGSLNMRSTSGAMYAQGGEATIESESGSVDFTVSGSAHVTTNSGSISGVMGDGGAVESTSGSINLIVTQPLVEDLRVQSRSGSIGIAMPNRPCTLVVTSDHGDVSIRIGELVEHGRNVRIDIAGGGPLVQVVTTSGSVDISDR